MRLPSTGRANARRVCLGRTLAAALACALLAGRATAQESAGPAADLTSAAPAPTKEAVLAEESRWLSSKLPKLARASVVLQVYAHVGGTDVASGRTWVTRAKLDRCTLAIDRMFETVGTDPVAPVPKLRVSNRVPLDRVDVQSLAVQQTPPGGLAVGLVSGHPWRVVLSLTDGTIRSDRDRDADPYAETGPEHTTSNDTELDLIVSSQEAGTEILPHLRSAILACQ